jgi:hypothetical protein
MPSVESFCNTTTPEASNSRHNLGFGGQDEFLLSPTTEPFLPTSASSTPYATGRTSFPSMENSSFISTFEASKYRT